MTAIPTDALGRTMICALLMANGIQKEQMVQITINGNGPLRGVVAICTGDGQLRGYVGTPQLQPGPVLPMSSRSHGLDEAFHAYVLKHMVAVPPAVSALEAEADKLPERQMRMAAEQGRCMAFLIELLGARQIIEVGTFVGYGTLWMAMAVPPGGRVVALDIEARFPEIGRPFWRKAGVEKTIDLRIAPALQTLEALRREGGEGQFDMAFIDADKSNYVAYYEHCLALLRTGGVILIDNVFWGGEVADAKDQSADTQAIRAVMAKVMADRRVSAATIPIGDGLTLVRKL